MYASSESMSVHLTLQRSRKLWGCFFEAWNSVSQFDYCSGPQLWHGVRQTSPAFRFGQGEACGHSKLHGREYCSCFVNAMKTDKEKSNRYNSIRVNS